MAAIHKVVGEKKEVREITEDRPFSLSDASSVSLIFGVYTLTAKAPVRLNGREFVGQRKLSDKSVIVVGKERFIFYNEEEAADQEKRASERIKTAADLEQKYNLDEIKQTAKALLAQFINNKNATKRLKNFAQAFCQFVQNFCSLQRAVLYTVDGKKWKPAFALAPEKAYKPPLAILKSVYVSGQPTFRQIQELDKNDLSRSIVDNKIQSAICFPIYPVDSISCVAVFYGDTSGDPLDDKKFLIINYLCQYISKHIAQFAHKKGVDSIVPKLTQIELPGGGENADAK